MTHEHFTEQQRIGAYANQGDVGRRLDDGTSQIRALQDTGTGIVDRYNAVAICIPGVVRTRRWRITGRENLAYVVKVDVSVGIDVTNLRQHRGGS